METDTDAGDSGGVDAGVGDCDGGGDSFDDDDMGGGNRIDGEGVVGDEGADDSYDDGDHYGHDESPLRLLSLSTPWLCTLRR